MSATLPDGWVSNTRANDSVRTTDGRQLTVAARRLRSIRQTLIAGWQLCPIQASQIHRGIYL